ncbi:MAG: hypothetical protein ABGZ53_19380 [Fuerstiella sp.]
MTWILCLLALLAFGMAAAVVTMIVRQMSQRNGGGATALGVLATGCLVLLPGMLVLWLVLARSHAPTAITNVHLDTEVEAVMTSVRAIQEDVARMAPLPPAAPFPSVADFPPGGTSAPEVHVSPFDSPSTALAPLPDVPGVEVLPGGMGANAHSMLEHAELTVWANTDLQKFTANAYPGVLAAVKPLARKVRETLDANQLLVEPSGDEGKAIASIESSDDAEAGSAVVTVESAQATVAVAEATDAVESTDTAEAAEAEAEASAEVVEVAVDAAVETPNTRDATPPRVIVTGHRLSDKYRGNVLQRFTEQLRIEFPDSEVSVFDGANEPHQPENEISDNTVVLTLSLEDERSEQAPWDYKVQQQSGRHRCDIVTSKGSATATTSYIEKPWVDAFDVFISARPERRLIVGYSEKFVSAAEAARRLAMKDARSKSRVATGSGVFATADESHVIDRFAQKLSRPYGDVWREAVLLDVSGARMAHAIATARTQTVHIQEQRFSVGAYLLILFGVTMVLCVILNLLTQGYYRKRLLMTGGIVAAIMLLLVLGAVN